MFVCFSLYFFYGLKEGRNLYCAIVFRLRGRNGVGRTVVEVNMLHMCEQPGFRDASKLAQYIYMI